MNKLIENNLEQIKIYCQKFDVKTLHAFGSVATDDFTKKSDVDLLVKFKKIPFEKYADNYFRLYELFEINRSLSILMLSEKMNGTGIHWEEIDEDISVPSLLMGKKDLTYYKSKL